jgi:hypothetical protein
MWKLAFQHRGIASWNLMVQAPSGAWAEAMTPLASA